MKKIILSLAVLFLLAQLVRAQTDISRDQTLSYDLMALPGSFPGDFKIRKNVRFRYRIANLNRNIYTVSINSSSVNLFTDKPPIFGLITDIDLSKLTPAVTAGQEAELAGDPLDVLTTIVTGGEQLIVSRYLTAKSKVNSLIANLERNNVLLKKINGYYNLLTGILQDGITTFTALQTQKISGAYSLLKADFGYTGNATDENALLISLKAAAETLFQSLLKDYDELIKARADMQAKLLLAEQLVTAKTKALTDSLKKASADKKVSIQRHIKDISNEINVEKLISDGIDAVINDIKLAHTKIVEQNDKDFVQAMITVYRKINQSNWEYVSASIKGEKDQVKVKIDIQPKEGSLFNNNYAQFNGEYTGDVYGFKINFSTGLFMLIGKDLFDRSYRVDTIAGDLQNSEIVENDSRQSVQPAVGALLHFYNKRPGDFSWGGAFGFSISNQTRLNYHAGFSFIFGQEQRIIANLGVTLAQVKELGSAYSVGQKVTRTSGFNVVPTENFYKGGAFLALTYNLSN